ncbi:MAG: UDP-4-amino-4,6-dideoxy-N-acetyl-beta-L-altrosamine N-acetyltransferase [Phenylobacterium sp.]
MSSESGTLHRLRSILACSPGQQETVRTLRNDPAIRGAMFTDHVISAEEHARWLSALAGDRVRRVFVVLDPADCPLGVVSLSAIDPAHGKADWGFYLSPQVQGGLGSIVLFQLIEFAFEDLGLEKLNGEALEGNAASLAVHRKLLFREEGYRRSQIVRGGSRLGVHLLGLTREDWRSGREGVLTAPPPHRVILEGDAT